MGTLWCAFAFCFGLVFRVMVRTNHNQMQKDFHHIWFQKKLSWSLRKKFSLKLFFSTNRQINFLIWHFVSFSVKLSVLRGRTKSEQMQLFWNLRCCKAASKDIVHSWQFGQFVSMEKTDLQVIFRIKQRWNSAHQQKQNDTTLFFHCFRQKKQSVHMFIENQMLVKWPQKMQRACGRWKQVRWQRKKRKNCACSIWHETYNSAFPAHKWICDKQLGTLNVWATCTPVHVRERNAENHKNFVILKLKNQRRWLNLGRCFCLCTERERAASSQERESSRIGRSTPENGQWHTQKLETVPSHNSEQRKQAKWSQERRGRVEWDLDLWPRKKKSEILGFFLSFR